MIGYKIGRLFTGEILSPQNVPDYGYRLCRLYTILVNTPKLLTAFADSPILGLIILTETTKTIDGDYRLG